MNQEFIDYEQLEYLNLSHKEVLDIEEVLLTTENVNEWNTELERLGCEPSYGSESPEVLFIRGCPKNYFTTYKDEPYCRFPNLLDEMNMPSYALSFAWPRMNPNLGLDVSMPLGCGEVRRLHRLTEHQVRLFNPRMIVFMDDAIKFYDAYVLGVDHSGTLTDDVTFTKHKIMGRLATFTMGPAALVSNADDFTVAMETIRDEVDVLMGSVMS